MSMWSATGAAGSYALTSMEAEPDLNPRLSSRRTSGTSPSGTAKTQTPIRPALRPG